MTLSSLAALAPDPAELLAGELPSAAAALTSTGAAFASAPLLLASAWPFESGEPPPLASAAALASSEPLLASSEAFASGAAPPGSAAVLMFGALPLPLAALLLAPA